MWLMKVYACYLVAGWFWIVVAQNGNISRSTMDDSAEVHSLSLAVNKILKTYNLLVRPNAGGEPIMVEVQFKIISFGELDELNMAYPLDIFVRQWWKDSNFKNDFNMPYTMAVDPREMFWIPDTYFVNVKDSRFHFVTKDNMRILIFPDGQMYFSSSSLAVIDPFPYKCRSFIMDRISLQVQCDMDFRLYPVDTQYCDLIVESYAYTTDDVDYKWRGKKAIEIVSDRMAQYYLESFATYKKDSTNSKGSFASLKASFVFKRRVDFYISAVYIPGVVLVILSWCSYFISPAVVPARTALCITTILSTILLQANSNKAMPKVSYIKALDVFLVPSFVFVFAAMIEFIVVLNTDPTFRKPKFLRNCLGRTENCEETTNENLHEDEEFSKIEIHNADNFKNQINHTGNKKDYVDNRVGSNIELNNLLKKKKTAKDTKTRSDAESATRKLCMDPAKDAAQGEETVKTIAHGDYGDDNNNVDDDDNDDVDDGNDVDDDDDNGDDDDNDDDSDDDNDDDSDDDVDNDADDGCCAGGDDNGAKTLDQTLDRLESNGINSEHVIFAKKEEEFSEDENLLTLPNRQSIKKTMKDVIIGMLTEGVYVVTETQGNIASGFFRMTLMETTVPIEYEEGSIVREKPEVESEPEPERKPKLQEKKTNKIHWLDGAARILLPISYCSFLLFYLIYYSRLRS